MKLAEHVAFAEIDHGMALLDQRSGEYWSLNSTGTVVVSELLQGGTPETAIDHLAQQYHIERALLSDDVYGLLDDLRNARLLEVEDVEPR